ncbi:MAG: glycerophosphodiester phosphodiesterase [Bacillota bacterium]
MKTQVYAHRGASGYAPENTIAAFRRAIDMGADGIELDVHLSRDGRLVVIHDETVDRTSNGRGYVRDKTLKELRELDFSFGVDGFAGEKIPTLEEVYALLTPTGLKINVEIKSDIVLYPGIESALVELQKQAGMAGRILYSSFNHYSLRTLRSFDPGCKIGLLYSGILADPWVYAKYMDANALHPQFRALLMPGLFENCLKEGLELNVWTVNTPEYLEKCIGAGCTAVITNYPDVARGIRDRMGA